MVMDIQQSELILQRLEKKDKSLDNQSEIAEAINFLADYWHKNLKSLGMKGVEAAPDWLSFELKIWELGELLRLFIREKKDWRGKSVILDAVEKILKEKKYGKGRQTFALLLGDFGKGEYGEALGSVLDQADVYGHAIDSLLKAKIGNFIEEIKKISEIEKGWIRKSAKKYLKQFSPTSS
jgi:hypothetical protein